jgi:hypothetical protein
MVGKYHRHDFAASASVWAVVGHLNNGMSVINSKFHRCGMRKFKRQKCIFKVTCTCILKQ